MESTYFDEETVGKPYENNTEAYQILSSLVYTEEQPEWVIEEPVK